MTARFRPARYKPLYGIPVPVLLHIPGTRYLYIGGTHYIEVLVYIPQGTILSQKLLPNKPQNKGLCIHCTIILPRIYLVP